MVNHINNINGPQSSTAQTSTNSSGGVDNNSDSNAKANSRASADTLVDSNNDTVQLSVRAQELNRIQRDLQALPEIDEARVNDIRERIDNGTYTVDADQVATRILADEQLFGG
ncbi:MAG: flagellar biosynthesis anti-sigma factor FlgM [Pseudomonadales bacterium]